MGYKITFKNSVRKDFLRVPEATARRILDAIDSKLGADPLAQPALQGQFAGLRKLRIGDYRVVYSLDGESVTVLRVGHRKEVYRG